MRVNDHLQWSPVFACEFAGHIFQTIIPVIQQGWLSMTYALLKNTAATRGNFAYGVQERPAWLISPGLDLFFVCGLAPWLLGFAIYLFTGGHLELQKSPQYVIAILFATASLIIGESHQFTSIVRYYGTFRSRSKAYKLDRMPFWTIYAGLGLVVCFVAGWTTSWPGWVLGTTSIVSMVIVTVAVSLFPVVLMQHFCAQAQAIGLMYCGLGDYKLSQPERTSTTVISWLLVGAGASSIARPFGFNPTFEFGICFVILMLIATNALTRHLNLGDRCLAWVVSLLVCGGVIAVVVPDFMGGRGIGALFMTDGKHSIMFEALPNLLQTSAAGAIFLFALHVLRRGFGCNEWLPKGAVLLWANLALFILVVPFFPPPIMLPIWMLVPVFFHASQHWAVAWYTRAKEIESDKRDFEKRENSLWNFCKLFLPVQALSLTVLFLPLIASHIPGVHLPDIFGSRGDPPALSTLPVGWSMLVFYMHYFADRLVWRPIT